MYLQSLVKNNWTANTVGIILNYFQVITWKMNGKDDTKKLSNLWKTR